MHFSVSMDTQAPFRFLDLPKELRLIIYDYLSPPIVTMELTHYIPDDIRERVRASIAENHGEAVLVLHHTATQSEATILDIAS